jgi:putative alpha-1,2-mannosidase
VSDLFPEDSAVGRMQLNEYTRGTYDDPRAILMKRWEGDYLPIIKYYSLKEAYIEPESPKPDDSAKPFVDLEYVPYPSIDETIVMICPRLEYAVLNEIAAMVLESLNEHEKASLYRAKSKEYLEVK